MSLMAKEWKALVSNKKVLIPVLAVLFIPLMYAGMFLWAFWDPYEQLDQLPVAVVNEDTGADYEGTELQIGSELVDNLKANPKFKWEFVSKDEAVRGLENEQYYMMIEIPENFSENATTLMDEDPQSLELKYVPNEGFNFLSGQIGGTAVAQIKEEVSNTITKTYAESIFENIDKLADGLGDASEGAGKIDEGVIDLKGGSAELKEKLELLAGKSITFKDGLNDASAGAKKLADGAQKLDSGLGQLQDGSGKLYSGSMSAEKGAAQLNEGLGTSLSGMKELQSNVPKLTAGAEGISAGAGELSGGLNRLSDGSTALAAGAGELSTGLDKLSAGNQAAYKGAGELSAGLTQLNDQLAVMLPQIEKLPLPEAEKQKLIEAAKGVSQLSEGSKQLESSLGQLSAGAADAQKGAATIADKSAELSAGAGKLQEGASKLSSGSSELAAGQKKAEEGINQLVAGQEKLYAGSGDLLNGQKQLTEGQKTFNQEFAKAKAGSAELAAGNSELGSGISKLAEGSGALQDGTNKLADGAGKVDEGVGKLSEGTGELSSKLGDAAEETKDAGGSDETYDMISEPVKVKDEKINAVPNYGTGFAPYFLSLGLFVGALLLSIVFPLRQAAGTPKSAIGWFMSKFGVLAAVGVIQALLADAVLLYGLDIEVQSVPLFILFSIITSLAFLTLVQFFVTSLGDPGRFVAIIILILQLTTSAGTFPLELIPEPLQIFNAWLPMTYTVSGFKAVISSGDYSFMWQQAGILGIFIAAMIAGTIAYFFMAIRKNKNSLTEKAAA
ncbi:YhgE/Pip domain-containing protein [Metabacillus indicus]|uniref:YhgE/Pip domain-containing protein n=1 Tax=Metabacillus indicus TaxID=246786 RepID=UPI002A0964F9|nr:YhgE/Pip domain-containing protein [Metabacillus indicus]MDX8289487.1 YhgE/Pip domain-containing protein [Metabacillus indicus]